jgi:putative transposase
VDATDGGPETLEKVLEAVGSSRALHGYPLAMHTDNGPEFSSWAFMAWASAHGIRHILIEPGRPMQNGYIESFNGKSRDDCLNDQWFKKLNPTIAASR